MELDPEKRCLSLRDELAIDVPRRCGDCGYELTALPSAGRCPECGQVYLEDELVLFGWAGGNDANIATAHISRMLWVLVPIMLAFLVIGVLSIRRDPIWTLLWSLIGVFVLTRMAWIRYSNAAISPAPVQLRISPHGIGRREGVGPVGLLPWGDTPFCKVTSPTKKLRRLLIARTFDAYPIQQVDFLLESTTSPELWTAKVVALFARRSSI